MKAFVTLVCATVPEKDATLGPKLEFMIVVGAKARPTGTAKSTKESIVWSGVEQALQRGIHINSTCRETMDQKTCSMKCLIPKSQWHGSLGEQVEAGFDDMAVFSFR